MNYAAHTFAHEGGGEGVRSALSECTGNYSLRLCALDLMLS